METGIVENIVAIGLMVLFAGGWGMCLWICKMIGGK